MEPDVAELVERRGAHALDLAGDVPRAAGAGEGPPLDADLRQQPPPGRAPGAAAERAGRRGGRARPPRQPGARAAGPHRGAAQGRRAAGAGGHQQPGARHRHGRGGPGHPGREPAQRGARHAAHRPRRAPGGRAQPRAHLPQVPRRPARVRGGGVADAERRDRGDARAAPAARRAGPADRGHERGGGPDAWTRSRRRSAAPTPSPSSRASSSRACWTCSPGRYPSDEFAELRPRIVWDRSAGTVRGREGARSLAVQNAGTIPDRGLFAVVLPDGARVGELDEEMVYEARSGQTFMLGRLDLAHRGDHPRPGDRHAGPGGAGRPAVLEGRGGGPALRAGRGRGPAGARAGGGGARAGRRRGCASRERLRGARRRQPGRLPRGPGGRDRGRAERPRDRDRALPRRDRRLAPLRADALRRPRPRALGPGAGRAPARLHRPGGARDLGRRRHRRPPARRRRGAVGRRRPDRAGRARGADPGRAGRDRPVRGPLPRERRPRPADPAPPPRPADAAVAAAPEGLVAAPGGAPLRQLPGDPRDLPRGAQRLVRPAGPARADGADRVARGRGGGGRDARRLALRRLAAVRVRGLVHVRGRHARRRAARAGAVAQPRPAARAAGPGGAARPDRPRGARRRRGRPPGALGAGAGARAGRPPRPAAPHRRPDRRRGGRRAWPSPSAPPRSRWRWSPSAAPSGSTSPASGA